MGCLRHLCWAAWGGAMFALAGCASGSSSDSGSRFDDADLLTAARQACSAAADYDGRACRRNCARLGDEGAAAACSADCDADVNDRAAACDEVAELPPISCTEPASCLDELEACRDSAASNGAECEARCGTGPLVLRCVIRCDRTRAADEAACGFVAIPTSDDLSELPDLPTGLPADLPVLLDEQEMMVVEAADQRAEALRTRVLRLHIGSPDVEVRITQIEHGFEFGFPIDFREFRDAPEDLAFYEEIARAHTPLMVAETALKWRQLEPEPGRLEFDLGNSELAWADENGFKVKMHTLLWGNAPPLSTGSGTPEWLRDRFLDPNLTPSEQDELRELIRFQAASIVDRYKGRIDIYDITNEMLNPFTAWFADRLGPSIVDDLFRWVREIDPGAELVMNEWISEVFTGLGGADAATVRDRVLELQAAGVPIDAVGIQAHFVPGFAFVTNPDIDDPLLMQRTRIDDYADALDILAEPGLPLHMTETTFNAPADPEQRAAQAEAIMRLWWGTEAVEQVVFWSLWNKVAARNQLQHGIFDDTRDGTLTRHGEAVISLINDRWRTDETVNSDEAGTVELRVTLGEHVARWTEDGEEREARFVVKRGNGPLTIVVVR